MKVSVTKEAVSLSEQSVISQGDYAVNECTFDLPDCFVGLNVTAVFNNIPVPVTEGKCIVPSLKKGNGVLGVYAYKKGDGENSVELMYSPKPCMFWVGEGSYTDEISVENIPAISEFEEYCNNVSAYYEANLKAFSELVKGCERQENRTDEINDFSTDNEYPSAKAVYEAIKPVKELLSADSGGNLFNKNAERISASEITKPTDFDGIITGALLNHRTGELYISASSFITPYIPVENGKSYTSVENTVINSAVFRMHLYNENKEWLGIIEDSNLKSGVVAEPGTVTVNKEEAVFCRLDYTLANIDTYMVVEGSIYPEEYQEYGTYLNENVKIPQLEDYVPSADIDNYIPYDDIAELQENVVRLEKGAVFLEWEIGRIDSSTGVDINTATNGIRTTGYIELKDIGILKVECETGHGITNYLIEYDENKNFICYSTPVIAGSPVLTPTSKDCKFIRIATFESGKVLDNTSLHSKYISVYYDGASVEYLVGNTNELKGNVVRLETGTIFPEWEIGRITPSTGVDVDIQDDKPTTTKNGIRTPDYIELQDIGILKVECETGHGITNYLIEYDEDKKFISYSTPATVKSNILTPTSEKCKFIRIATLVDGVAIENISEHSQYISVYFDKFSIEYLNEKVNEIDKNRIRYSYAFDNILLKSINHRGFNTIAPENTLPAYRLSKRNGFKFVECDIGLTLDKIPVLLHDDTINRTARNADGTTISESININDITYEQALTYDFGIWKGETYAGIKIPTFEEFIVLCRDLDLYPYIELKSTNTYEQSDIDNIVGTVAKYGLERSATYISNSVDVLKMVVVSNKTARVGALLAGNANDTFCNSVKSKLDTGVNEVFFDILVTYATESNLAICEQYGFPVEVYCPNTEDAILTLDKRISGVTSDIFVAENIIRENNLGNSGTGLIE